jgi:hypothetical protein
MINKKDLTYVLVNKKIIEKLTNDIPNSELFIAGEDISSTSPYWGNTFDYKRAEKKGYEENNNMEFHRLRIINIFDIPKVLLEIEVVANILKCLNKVSVIGEVKCL